MNRRQSRVLCIALGVVLTSAVIGPGVAFADESRTGYKSCGAGQHVRVDVYGTGQVSAYWTTGPDHLGGHSGQNSAFSDSVFTTAVSITAPYNSVQWRATAVRGALDTNTAAIGRVDVLCV